jgi:eukaryotic-like serine/threonine-protein kinase
MLDPDPTPAGTRVGRHLITGPLPGAPPGSAYVAHDSLLGRTIVLRFLADGGPADAASAAAMSRLEHPNVVRVHDAGVWQGRSYLALEHLEGPSLAGWLRARPRTTAELKGVLAAAARGLQAAHDAGVTHGPLDADGIVVAGARVAVGGFGLAPPDPASPPTAAEDVRAFARLLTDVVPAGARLPRDVQRLLAAAQSRDPAARPSMAAFAQALESRRGRRVHVLVSAGVAALVATAAFWVGGRWNAGDVRLCQGGGTVIDGLLGPPRLRALAARFDTAGLGDMWAAARPRFEAWAQAWRTLHGDTCVAAHGARRLSPSLLDLRMRCLDGQRESVAAVLAAVPAASPAQLARVAAAPLPALVECAVASDGASLPLPTDPAIRRRVDETTRILSWADAQLLVGAFADARRVAGEALVAARQVGHAPLVAQALMQLAAVELRGVKDDEAAPAAAPGGALPVGPARAVKLLEEAVTAAEAGRDDDRRAQAATQLALAFRDLSRPADARRWVSLAGSTISRVGDPPTRRAALDYVVGWLALDTGDVSAAAIAFDRSLRLRRQALGPRAPEVLTTMSSGCQARPDQPARVACLREAVALATAAVGPRHLTVATIKSNLANWLLRDERTRPEACGLIRECLAIEQAVLDPHKSEIIRTLNYLAECLKEPADQPEVRRLYADAVARATSVSMARADLYTSHGTYLAMNGAYAEAIPWFRKAAADGDVVYGPVHDRVIFDRYNIADMYRRLGQPQTALRELAVAIDICERGGATVPDYADLHELEGTILFAMKRKQEAYQALRRSLALHEQLKTPPQARYMVLHSLGQVERQTGRVAEAIDHLEQALAIHAVEVDPQRYADAAIELAQALVAAGGRANHARACTLGAEALAAFGQPSQGGPREEIPLVRRWLARQGCRRGP